jgi:hypothetical protein
VSLTAQVIVAQSGAVIPTGEVQFFDGTILLGAAPVVESGGVFTASFETLSLVKGTHSLTARYLGDENFESSVSPKRSHRVR